jgi:hypothetical protein
MTNRIEQERDLFAKYMAKAIGDRMHPDDNGHTRVLEIVRPVFESMVQLKP